MSDVNIFSIVPVEMLADRRLTLWHMRVLIGLLSFRSKNTDHVWPSREALAERCGGMHLTNVSKVTSELCELGWLVKDGNGGKSRATRYRITVPDLQTVADSATVAESATQPPQTVADSATQTVADSARGKEETNELTTKSNKPIPAASKSQQDEITWDDQQKIFTGISDAQMRSWEEAFPKLDIDSELTRIELWYNQNPKKRKRRVTRFITCWLSRTYQQSQVRKVFVKQPPVQHAQR